MQWSPVSHHIIPYSTIRLLCFHSRFHFDPASGTLSLPLVQCDNAGWYTCVASDGSETAEKRVYLTVLCGTGKDSIILEMRNTCTKQSRWKRI